MRMPTPERPTPDRPKAEREGPVDAKGLHYPFDGVPEEGAVRQVAEGVHWVRMPLPMTLNHINLWLLEDHDGWTVVDTGLNYSRVTAAWEKIFVDFLAGRPVKRVIVTHLHPDHVGLAGWFTRRFGVHLWMSRTDYLMCRNLTLDTGREAPPEALSFYRAAGFTEEALAAYRERFGYFGRGIFEMPDSFRRIVDGEILDIGGRYWQVVMGSGHAPEHACLYCPGLKLLISGDQVLPRITSNVSVFPTEPFGDPLKDWIASCGRLREILPGDLLVLPAHNEPFFGLHQRLTALIDNHEQALTRLLDILDTPKRAIDCFSPLFKRTIGPEVFSMATGEALAHLNCLIGRRLVARLRDEHGVDWYRRIAPEAKAAPLSVGIA
ncbi:MAG: MBL fold metallo-hydrolase [Alphaproteobacteria bacterium]|nr:MBL fold metallo-hydrolase [Alphaproteobacteria bacterium]